MADKKDDEPIRAERPTQNQQKLIAYKLERLVNKKMWRLLRPLPYLHKKSVRRELLNDAFLEALDDPAAQLSAIVERVIKRKYRAEKERARRRDRSARIEDQPVFDPPFVDEDGVSQLFNDDDKQIFALYVSGCTVKEICQLLKITDRTVTRAFDRGRTLVPQLTIVRPPRPEFPYFLWGLPIFLSMLRGV